MHRAQEPERIRLPEARCDIRQKGIYSRQGLPEMHRIFLRGAWEASYYISIRIFITPKVCIFRFVFIIWLVRCATPDCSSLNFQQIDLFGVRTAA